MAYNLMYVNLTPKQKQQLIDWCRKNFTTQSKAIREALIKAGIIEAEDVGEERSPRTPRTPRLEKAEDLGLKEREDMG